MLFKIAVVLVLAFMARKQYKFQKAMEVIVENQSKMIKATNVNTKNVVALYEVNESKKNDLH